MQGNGMKTGQLIYQIEGFYIKEQLVLKVLGRCHDYRHQVFVMKIFRIPSSDEVPKKL